MEGQSQSALEYSLIESPPLMPFDLMNTSKRALMSFTYWIWYGYSGSRFVRKVEGIVCEKLRPRIRSGNNVTLQLHSKKI